MSSGVSDQHCVRCEKLSHWIEIIIRDEHNNPFNNVPGILIDAVGNEHNITLNSSPILLTTLAAGKVTLTLDYDKWIKDAQDKKRKPNPDEEPTKEYAEGYVGYKKTSPKFVRITAGDLTEIENSDEHPEQNLPQRHQAGQAEPLKLITDKSYILEVRAFNYITLRFGVFFDGTANNTYSATWGKQKHEAYISRWKALYDIDKGRPANSGEAERHKYHVQHLSGDCFVTPHEDTFWIWQDDERVESSASNEWTNVQKLYDRYTRDDFNSDQTSYSHSEYITGIGTGNEIDIAPAKESTFGQVFGTGEYGVIEKTETAIQQILNSLDLVIDNIQERASIDGFSKFEFDVFGFSRGSAAARNFINAVLDNNEQQLKTKLIQKCQNRKWPLGVPNEFSWEHNHHCEITFAGLFDTVAAIGDFTDLDFSPHNDNNGKVKLWLDPERVRHAVHLTANDKTEYRKFFSVNKLNSASHFYEFELPGAHSDIGGGYHSKMSFSDKNYLLPRLENKVIKTVRHQLHDFHEEALKRRIEHELNTAKQQEMALGWHPDDLVIEVKRQSIGKEGSELIGQLTIRRVVEGDLSRLYLRVMYGLAEHFGVPLHEIDPRTRQPVWEYSEESYYSVPRLLTQRKTGNSFSFGEKCAEILSIAKSGDISALKTRLECTDLLKQCMAYNLVHHSSSTDISGHPFTQHGAYQRARYHCDKNS